MNIFKRLIFGILLGFSLGAVIASLAAPSFLAWYNVPGAGDALCNCKELAHSSIDSLLHTQMVGAGIGIAICVAGAVLLGGKSSPPPSHTVNR